MDSGVHQLGCSMVERHTSRLLPDGGKKVFIIMAMSKFGYFSFLLPYLFEIIIKNILKLKLITYFNQGTFTLCYTEGHD